MARERKMEASEHKMDVHGLTATAEVLAEDNSADVSAPSPSVMPSLGYVDIYGYSSAAGGWLFGGWVPRPPDTDRADSAEFIAQYEASQSKGAADLAFYQRQDIESDAIGFIAFTTDGGRDVGRLQHITFCVDRINYRAKRHLNTTRLLDQELLDRLRPHLTDPKFASRTQKHLVSITSRPGFAGQDTLSSLKEPVLMQIDEAISCPPDGILLRGWQLAQPGVVRRIQVRSGPLAVDLDLSLAIRNARPDVIAALRQEFGFSDDQCGFIAYLPACISSGDPSYIEVTLCNGDIGFKTFKISKRTGIDAIRGILEGVDVRHGELDPAFDNVLGPAISCINEARLRQPPTSTEIQFGRAPENPEYSLIVPLYGRVDFIEYQMALFSQQQGAKDLDVIYVLDDPPKQRELEDLAHSTFARFRIAFRVLLLTANLGFAPASNAGLRIARGRFVCFLNSDVFPITGDWMQRLSAALERHPDIGVIGPRLLYEDGSIQHEGCFYRVVPELAGWTFSDHHNKGRRPAAAHGLWRHEAITGACMVLTRSFALELGGFDEAYVVGDFEDMDLCQRIRARGLACAVDDNVQLYHLERKSQAESNQGWRCNLTLYNAWLHQRRWISATGLRVRTEAAKT
jgi:GT2 family glycosyltransferase